jgi:DNA mismatch endonuclease, patch repair protein
MSKIRSQDTQIEVSLRRALFAAGLRFRKNYRGAIGKPDVALVRLKVAVFCDSSFWHGRDLIALEKRLRTNKGFWLAKIQRNVARDRAVDDALKSAGWLVLRFWEEDLIARLDRCVATVLRRVSKRQQLRSRRFAKASVSKRVSGLSSKIGAG